MLIFKGEAVETPEEKTKESCDAWPHIYAHLDVKPEDLINDLQANHVHAIEGDYVKELEKFCRMIGIRCTVLDNR